MFRTIAIATMVGMFSVPAIAQDEGPSWAEELVGVNERMDQYDRRFAEYDQRFEGNEARMDRIERRFEELYDGLERSGVSLESTIEAQADEERDLVTPGTTPAQ